tara:strand:+ start:474 stop:800 length:327 start_codon:yes stop_codon:yes gene_type:complete
MDYIYYNWWAQKGYIMPGKFRHVIEYVNAESTEAELSPKPRHFKFTEECINDGKIIDIDNEMISSTKRQITLEFQDSATRDWWWETIEAMADSAQPSNVLAYHDRTFY